MIWRVDLWLALGVLLSTAATDAVYVMFNAAVSARRRVPAATWSSLWYLLSAFAVISYTKNWSYVGFAALGSWIGVLSLQAFGDRFAVRKVSRPSRPELWRVPADRREDDKLKHVLRYSLASALLLPCYNYCGSYGTNRG